MQPTGPKDSSIFVIDTAKNQIKVGTKRYNVILHSNNTKEKLGGKDLERIVKILTQAGLDKPTTNFKETVIRARKITEANVDVIANLPEDKRAAVAAKIEKTFTKIVTQHAPTKKAPAPAPASAPALTPAPAPALTPAPTPALAPAPSPEKKEAPAPAATEDESSDEASANSEGDDNVDAMQKSADKGVARKQAATAARVQNAHVTVEEVEDEAAAASESEQVEQPQVGVADDLEIDFNALAAPFQNIPPDAPIAIRSIKQMNAQVAKDLELNPARKPHVIGLRGDGDCGYRAVYIGIMTHFILNHGTKGIEYFLNYVKNGMQSKGFTELTSLFPSDGRYALAQLAKTQHLDKQQLLQEFYKLCLDKQFDREFSLLTRVIANQIMVDDTLNAAAKEKAFEKAVFDASIPHPDLNQEELLKYYAESPGDFIALSDFFGGIPFVIRDHIAPDSDANFNYPTEFDHAQAPMTDYVMVLGGGDHFDLVIGL